MGSVQMNAVCFRPALHSATLLTQLQAEIDMSELYAQTHRAFQDRHDSRRLADRLESLAHAQLDAQDQQFIQSAPFFFLSTVDAQGHPTVSYKGGAPGFVRIVGPSELVFPAYDGNGMFLSLGNIASTAQVGMLFMSFEAPRRLRIQGIASVSANEGPHPVPGALYLVHVDGETGVRELRSIHSQGRPRNALGASCRMRPDDSPSPPGSASTFSPMRYLSRTSARSLRPVASFPWRTIGGEE